MEEAQRLEKRFGRRLICPGELSRATPAVRGAFRCWTGGEGRNVCVDGGLGVLSGDGSWKGVSLCYCASDSVGPFPQILVS